jgi:hypothetical protein
VSFVVTAESHVLCHLIFEEALDMKAMIIPAPLAWNELQSYRHIQNVLIQQTVQIALAILNKETADRRLGSLNSSRRTK